MLRTPIERFEEKVSPEPNTGCWLWTGALVPKGYGSFRQFTSPEVSPVSAHRFSYEHFIGFVPDALMVLHRCDVRWCVNPQHLYLGTALQNAGDAVRRRRLGKLGLFDEAMLLLDHGVHPHEVAKRLSLHWVCVYRWRSRRARIEAGLSLCLDEENEASNSEKEDDDYDSAVAG